MFTSGNPTGAANQRHCPQEVFDGFTYVLCRLVEPGRGGIAPGHHIGVCCLDSGEAAEKTGKENATMGDKSDLKTFETFQHTETAFIKSSSLSQLSRAERITDTTFS